MPGGPRAEVAMMCGMRLLGVGGEGKLPAEKRGQAKMFGDVHRRRRGPWNANVRAVANHEANTFTV